VQTGYKLVISNPATGREYVSTPIKYDQASPAGVTARLDNTIDAIGQNLAISRNKLEQSEADLKTYEAQAAKPFEYDDLLKGMESELTAVEARLQKGERGTATTEAPAEEEDQGEEGYRWGAAPMSK